MAYKVFFVEDEIVTREGIRNNVDWEAHGFEFCGDAPDGEMALPLLLALNPDVLITDIKMPFMDGLQLSQIVRQRMPATKIVILSGHDEFEYAQKAIKLGVSEYLLKPVTVQDLHDVLQKVASELDQERHEQRALQILMDHVQENRAALVERCLLELATGTASAAEALERSQMLGIDLVARCYLVAIVRVDTAGPTHPFDYDKCGLAHQRASSCVMGNPDAFLVKKDIEEWLLIVKGNSPEYVIEERNLLFDRFKGAIESAGCTATLASGAPHGRISEIRQSFIEAAAQAQSPAIDRRALPNDRFDKSELLKVDRSAIDDYLRFGTVEGFDVFFQALIRPLGETALKSSIVNNYILMDIVLAAAKFVDELGGNVYQIVPGLDNIEAILADIESAAQFRDHVGDVLIGALVFRDKSANKQYAALIRQAEDYIGVRFTDPDLSLNEVAARVGLSSCHFSAIFSQETGRTFKEHLTETRIRKAKELLRSTALKAFEISDQIGYNDAHYFSHVFRKATGLTPSEFRWQAQKSTSETG